MKSYHVIENIIFYKRSVQGDVYRNLLQFYSQKSSLDVLLHCSHIKYFTFVSTLKHTLEFVFVFSKMRYNLSYVWTNGRKNSCDICQVEIHSFYDIYRTGPKILISYLKYKQRIPGNLRQQSFLRNRIYLQFHLVSRYL